MCHDFYAQEGGENTVFRQEVDILQRFGETVELYTRDNRELAAYGKLARAGALLSGFRSSRTASDLRSVVIRFRPDVAIVQNVFPLVSPALYRSLDGLGVPVVQLVFNYRLIGCSNAQLFTEGALCERCVRGATVNAAVHRCLRDSRLLSLWYALILGVHRRLGTFRRSIDRFVVPHPFVGRKLVEGGYDAERIRVNPNPFRLPPVGGGEGPDPYVIYVGRVIREKGVLVLVRALEHVPPPLKLVIVGDGEALPEIRSYLAERPGLAARVELRGPVWGEAADALLAGSLACVLPSVWYDPSPLLLYNALAMGKPAVASDLGSQPEIVTDGVEGLIFRAGDALDLAAKIDRLVGDPSLRRRMGTAGRRKAETEFSPEAHYRRLHAVLSEVAGGRA